MKNNARYILQLQRRSQCLRKERQKAKTQQKLSKAFWKLDAEERRIKSEENGSKMPEIELGRVFVRLLFECGQAHESAAKISGYDICDLRKRYQTDKDSIVAELANSDWAFACANIFRISSRKHIRPYPNTVSLLKKLKEQGKKVYLLSNAAGIFTLPEIEQMEIAQFFDKMYISSDYGIMKPEPDFLKLLIQEQELENKETVMVGNEIKSDVAIALECGINSIYVNSGRLPEKEIKLQIKEIMKATGAKRRLSPRIILSGDIGQVF